uniref:Uncharacterized protein n=1 Tax=Microcebus murinus TaxID=30608 RepID=A0A8C5UX91_MICMU
MLGAQGRAQVALVWALTVGQEAQFGAELWLRWLFAVSPRTKASFPHLGVSLHKLQLVSHEPPMLRAVAHLLRVDPLLIQCFQVVLVTVQTHAKRDKFLMGVAVLLRDKYL